jgi:hypothetical protein
MATLAEIVKADAVSSDNRWEGAIDSAERDGDAAAKSRWEVAREQCGDHYDYALEAIDAGDLGRAEAELDRCNALESEAGDNADAHHAIKAVRAAAEVAS